MIVLTRAEATESAVKRLAPGRRVIHLATHGVFLRIRAATALGRHPGIGSLGAPGLPSLPGEGTPPFPLSGLALAGANDGEPARPTRKTAS